MKIFGCATLALLVIGCGGNVFVDQAGAGGATGAGGAPTTSSRSSSGPVGSTTASENPSLSATVSGTGGLTSSFNTSSSLNGSIGHSSSGDVNPTSSSFDGPVTAVSSGTGPSCETCEQVVMGGDPTQICPGAEQQAFNTLLDCACTDGSCQARCGANVCIGDRPSPSCDGCLMTQCNSALETCVGSSSSAVATSASVGVATGSTGTSMMCSTCSEATMGTGDPNDLCSGSQMVYQDLIDCVCTTNCAMQCASACMGGNMGMQCQNCIFRPDPQGCSNEINACFAD